MKKHTRLKIIISLQLALIPLALFATSMAGAEVYVFASIVFFMVVGLVVASIAVFIVSLTNSEKWKGRLFKLWLKIYFGFTIPMIVFSIVFWNV